jgi:hypothetical protein
MKTLNRPMFRYGGPIKEGVMNGIKEPRQNYKEAGDVKKIPTSSREYKFSETPVAKGASGLVNYGPNAGIAAAYDLVGVPLNTLGRMFGYNPGFSGTKFVDTLTGGNFSKQTGYDRDKAKFLGFNTSAKKGFTTPSMKEKESDIDKSILTNEQKRIRELQALLDQKNKVDEVPTKSADELRQDRIQKYRDIMDIKGMNKNAAYDSLIAASQAISGEGDFKGSLKDGSLINKIIQSTSKAFDKPKQTKDAIDTLILKGEIEGDIAAGKPSTYLKAAQDMVSTGASKNIQEAMKTLTKSANSMSTTLGAILAKGNRLDENTVGVAYREETGNIPVGTTKLSVVNEWKEENAGKNEVDYVKALIEKGSELAAGDYIIGERVVTVNESGMPSFFY